MPRSSVVARERYADTPAIGAGESGKSTVLKQMRLIHTKGFSTQERNQWKVTIFQNLLNAFQMIFGAMEEQEVDFADENNIVRMPASINCLHLVLTRFKAPCRGHCRRPGHRHRRPYAA